MRTSATASLLLSLIVMFAHVARGDLNGQKSELVAEPAATQPANARETMKLNLKFRDKTLTATLIDNDSTRDCVSLLPLTLTMNDLFGREKYGRLPRAISAARKRVYTYEVGQLIY
jgi:hypothetical protein